MNEIMNTEYITNINIVLKSTPQKVSILIRLITWTSVPCVIVFIRKGTTGGSA